MKFGHELVYSMAEEFGPDADNEKWKTVFTQRYPWANQENLSHLFFARYLLSVERLSQKYLTSDSNRSLRSLGPRTAIP